VNVHRRAILFMIAFVAPWAFVESLASRVLLRYSPFQVVFTRYVVHLALMFAVWGFRAPSSLVRTSRPVYQLGRSLLMLGMPASYVFSFARGVDPRLLTSVFWLSPLFVLALGVVFLGERPGLGVWLASAAAYAALYLFTGFSPLPRLSLLIFPLCMAATLSAYVVMTRPLRTEPVRANLFYTALGVAVSLLPFIPHLWITPSPADFLVMATIGVVGFGGLFALDRATALAPTWVSAPFLYLQVPTFMVMERCLGRAQFGIRGLVATSFVALAALYLWRRESPGTAEAARV
jgi:drug/metabolite transporter (DMT)-like permease